MTLLVSRRRHAIAGLVVTAAAASRHAPRGRARNNLDYFGPPVYEYSIGAGQNDGYLAACEVKLMLDDRVQAMCADLFDHLLATGGPHQKTIIFCARDSHANQVMIVLNNLYADWCAKVRRTPKECRAFQCTGNPDLRPLADKPIPEFRGSKNSLFTATTVMPAFLVTMGVAVCLCRTQQTGDVVQARRAHAGRNRRPGVVAVFGVVRGVSAQSYLLGLLLGIVLAAAGGGKRGELNC